MVVAFGLVTVFVFAFSTVIDCWAVPGAKSSFPAWSALTTQEPGWLKVTTPAAIVQTPADAGARC